MPDASLEAYKSAPHWKEFFTETPVDPDDTNSITTITTTPTSTTWHTLQGVRLPNRPTTPGIYILTTPAGPSKVLIR